MPALRHATFPNAVGRAARTPTILKATGLIPRYLKQLQARLEAAGGEHFTGQRLTVGDLKVWMMVRWLRSGVLDHMPKDLVDRVAPLLVKHAERVAAQPKITAYYKARKKA